MIVGALSALQGAPYTVRVGVVASATPAHVGHIVVLRACRRRLQQAEDTEYGSQDPCAQGAPAISPDGVIYGHGRHGCSVLAWSACARRRPGPRLRDPRATAHVR